ncbi:uncharacterized protein K452DRAFT_9230 [Aplosporella prunicola CBS 121167]|uniref:Uncharacterized protein n=1 Tax=Aplosporella prunicola CBS 121167 TaxID=1176127 RepID=A0A6A6BUT6_9PEZI|nr:uncharacterized protein K452DRAFT_9230 [Aplosporella prunicola CBS 121167]KAF2147588.1 hypothetical protein K452DRAFT_9230 [Aplosporella prunicola CBS 121167]
MVLDLASPNYSIQLVNIYNQRPQKDPQGPYTIERVFGYSTPNPNSLIARDFNYHHP